MSSPTSQIVEDVEYALKEVEEAVLFEDGVSAGLHEERITRLPEAYRRGRLDAIIEIRDILKERRRAK